MVRSKNQNKSRLSCNTKKLYRHLYKNTYRGCEIFCDISNNSRFFFQLRFCAFRSEKKIKNRDLFGILQNFAHPLYVFL